MRNISVCPSLMMYIYNSCFKRLPENSFRVSDYIKRLRYCEYLGRFFCQCCHENAQALLPGKILRKWDFSKSYVSNFARDLLAKIAGDPLFNLHDINSTLYKKMKALDTVRVSTFCCFSWTYTLSIRTHNQNIKRWCEVAQLWLLYHKGFVNIG